MSKVLKHIVVLLLCFGFMRCTEHSTAPAPKVCRELTGLEKRLVESDNKFGIKLFKAINNAEKSKNIFISPLSVSMALGMTYNGANGTTQKALQDVLEFGDLTTQQVNESYKSLIELLAGLDPKVTFQLANSIWYRWEFSFEADFINLNKTYFNAVVKGLDFNNPNASKTINEWVDENTNGKIKEIVDSPIDPSTVMFLINAIYFKGTWTYEFDKKLTQDDQFNLPDGSQTACKMMVQSGDFQYFSNPVFQAIDLPYGDGMFRMTIFLPNPKTNIDSLISEFNRENWNQWISSFAKHTGTLQFPRFTLEYELKLNAVLKALGMAIAFEPGQADFTNMYKGPQRLYISKVKHKTFVDVNEEGTEAAAVTSVEIGFESVGESDFSMRVDRPFVFVIRENHSQTILFIGKIVEPDLEL